MRQSFGIAVVVLFSLSGATLPAQRGPGEAPAGGPEAARCRALANFVVPDLPDASTRIQSARLVDVRQCTDTNHHQAVLSGDRLRRPSEQVRDAAATTGRLESAVLLFALRRFLRRRQRHSLQPEPRSRVRIGDPQRRA